MAQQIMPQSNIREDSQASFVNWWLWLTLPVAFGTLIAAVSGVINPDTYRNSLSLAAQGQGQDFVTLFIVLPVLLVSTFYAANNRLCGRIFWLGAMVYIFYTYVISAFQVEFNNLFLVYTALVGCTFYGIIFGLVTINWEQVRVGEHTPVKALSILMGLFALAYYGLWLKDVIPAIQTGTVPLSVLQDNIPTSAVHVLDMAFYLPLLLIGAFGLWQRKAFGYVIAGVALAFAPLMGIAVIAMIINMARVGLIDSVAPIIIFSVTTLLTGGALWILLRNQDL